MEGTATEILICGEIVGLGDTLKVEYKTGKRMKGATIQGKVTKLWDKEECGHHQAQLDSGWAFHDCDEILSHERVGVYDGNE